MGVCRCLEVWNLSHHEMLNLVQDVGGDVDAQAEVQAWAASSDKHWPAAQTTPRRVSLSVDGIMYCTNEREPPPDDPQRQRLKWQQMRVGCIDWQDEHERWHKQMIWGREEASAFGASLDRLACRCGYREAEEKLFAADGGEWCWNIHQQYFAAAQGLLDWSHASEQVWDTARVLHPDDDDARRQWARQALTCLHKGGGCGLLAWLTEERSRWRRAKGQAVGKLLNSIPSPNRSHGLSHLPQPRLADRQRHDRIDREATRRLAAQRPRPARERTRRPGHHRPASHRPQRPLAPTLDHPHTERLNHHQ